GRSPHSSTSNTPLPSQAAQGASHSGPQVAAKAGGITPIATTGIATKLVSGDHGATAWNHQPAAPSVPAVAPSVGLKARASQRSARGQLAGTAFSTSGLTRISPSTAPKES